MRRPRATVSRALAVLTLVTGLLAPAAAAAPSAQVAPRAERFDARIDAYARYDGQTQCLNVEQPGVRDFRALLQRTYGANGGGILRGCSVGGRSEHKEGRAYDWSLDASSRADRAKADDLLGWLLATDEHGNAHAMARRLGVMYIIWDRQQWSAYRPDAGWQPYTGASPHTDHIHFSFSWAGARRHTSWWVGTEGLHGGPFPDVPPEAYFHDPVVWMVRHRITGGRDDGLYGASQPVTRAHIVTFLWRKAGQPTGSGGPRFADVPADAFYAPAVAWATGEGIVAGTAAGRFDPDATVTRGQMASLLWRFVGSPTPTTPNRFVDVDARSHLAAPVAFLAEHGVTAGVDAQRYAPSDRLTRAQASALLYRLAGTRDAWVEAASVPRTVRFHDGRR